MHFAVPRSGRSGRCCLRYWPVRPVVPPLALLAAARYFLLTLVAILETTELVEVKAVAAAAPTCLVMAR